MINKVFVLSDVHLEKKSKIAQDFMLERINLLITQQEQQGVKPTLVLAGDIHNGVKGLAWMEKINAPIVYICGNHEFWENDYEEVIEELKNNNVNNISFLHNDFVEIDDYIFVGGTMWTDVGLTYNPDLFSHAAHIMNDTSRITYKSWYNDPENITNLKKLYSSHHFEHAVENKHWNILIESQENKKTTDFLNRFGVVISLLKNINEEQSHLERQLVSSYKPLTQTQYENNLQILLSFKNKPLKQWLYDCTNNHIINASYINKVVGSYNIESLEEIFNKLKHMNFNKKIMSVSHHLPFLEERLIGRQDWSRNKEIKLFNNLNESIYNIRSGINYPMHNYFHEIARGSYQRDESILQVVHYCNNGVSNLSHQFLNHVLTWVHGHEHHYNYQDFLKNVPIVTNPMGYSMDIFSFKEGKLSLSSTYKNYHEVTNEQQEIEEITSTFMRPVNINYTTQEQKEEIVKLWVLKSFDLDNYLTIQSNLLKFNKRLLNYLIKKPHIMLGKIAANEKEDLIVICSAINYQLNNLESEKTLLEKSVAIRLDKDYSFMNHQNNIYDSFRISNILNTEQFLNNVLSNINSFNLDVIEKIKEEKNEYINNTYDLLVEDAFFNVYVLEKKIKKAMKLKESLHLIESKYIYNIDSSKAADFFKQFLPNNMSYDEENEIMHNLMEKKKFLLEKHRTPEVADFLEKLNKKRMKDFDF